MFFGVKKLERRRAQSQSCIQGTAAGRGHDMILFVLAEGAESIGLWFGSRWTSSAIIEPRDCETRLFDPGRGRRRVRRRSRRR